MADITPLRSSDRPRWQELWSGYQRFYGVEIAADVTDQTWDRIQTGRIQGLGARDAAHRLVGIAHCLFHEDTWSKSPTCYLQDLFVDPAVRGHGHGRGLIHAVAYAARTAGAAGTYWLTHETNTTGRRLYDGVARNHGFIQYVYSDAQLNARPMSAHPHGSDSAPDESGRRRKRDTYRELAQQLTGLCHAERDGLANAANMAALLYHGLPDLNWAGFYFLRGAELVLGPFQGRIACVRIALGRGVCGTAAQRRETVIVPDVHEFAGHIACDAASQSEIVVPLLKNDRLLGVLDLDSPRVNRFDTEDGAGLAALLKILLADSDLGAPTAGIA